MSDTVIRVENLGKKYIIGHQQQGERYTALRDVIARGAKGLVNRVRNPKSIIQNPQSEEFWALKDVSFEIKRGDRVGIIGRNGAGKSTLLKILSRITEPTTGRIHINGRVASLLEVGTGFHPELTGRENIYLNGAILGMSKQEIRRNFDEIVAFAEVEKFLDTPVKRYSSGMYVRLAFAVAAHLEPEILLVDEVLAVGDISFQKKCISKMQNVSNEGRTIFLVSHNMAAVKKLCNTAILLRKGKVLNNDSTERCVSAYLQENILDSSSALAYSVNYSQLKASKNSGVEITEIEILTDLHEPANYIGSGSSLTVRIHYKAEPKYQTASIAFDTYLRGSFGQVIFHLNNMPMSGYQINNLGRQGYIDLKVQNLRLTAGLYFLDIGVRWPRSKYICRMESVISFSVTPEDLYGSGVTPGQDHGIIMPQHQWALKNLSEKMTSDT